MRKLWFAVPMALGVLTALPSAGDDMTLHLDRARVAADTLGSRLMSTLMRELQQGGPAGAVQVCSEQAQAIAEDLSRDGLTVRRVTLRPRNPKDAPDPYEEVKLLDLEAARAGGEMPPELYEEVTLEGVHQLRYLRPLTIRRPCLGCHGDPEELAPGVREMLQELYPEDRALGYAEGDLRGAISVTVVLD
ncbi:MAG: DUF3365 domain-containing protein [Acidobacteriota bacterium]|jgi:hypothetical protein